MKRVLSTAGDTLRLPFIAIGHEGGPDLVVTIRRNVRGLTQLARIELTREELKLLGRAIYDALDIPGDDP